MADYGWTAEKIAKWLTPDPRLLLVLEQWRARGLENLLDRGCGPGRHAMAAARMGFRVTGLDRSASALAHLRDRARQEGLAVHPVEGDIFTLPFPEGSFDCVVDYHASFHTDTAGYLWGVSELFRVLRPGGEAYVTVKSKRDRRYQEANPSARADRFTLLHEPGGSPHIYADPEELPELFPGFTFVCPPAEIREPGMASPEERVHCHLLLRRDR